MKLTDFALIFVGIFLPVVIIVYVNTSFVVKAEKQEMYYKNLMNSAITDAVSAMKQVENEDKEIDYGYSGIVDKKVSINAPLAISTFYNSLATNFNVRDNEYSLERLKMYIPVIAVLDYDGIYIHSAEENENKDIEFITKPKVYYTYYYVLAETVLQTYERTYQMIPLEDVENLSDYNLITNNIYEITFTMDDYIYLNVYNIDEFNRTLKDIVLSKSFYMTDDVNNNYLIHNVSGMISEDKISLKNQIVNELQNSRKRVIAEIGMREISYAANKHNQYAKNAGINYNFTFSVESDAAWYETMDGIGMIAIIQGVSFGNRYLNYKAYSASDLIVSRRYYVSKAVTSDEKELGYFKRDLYHISDTCNVYKQYINSTNEKIAPSYYTNKSEAATQGYYPCPICKP